MPWMSTIRPNDKRGKTKKKEKRAEKEKKRNTFLNQNIILALMERY